MEGKDIFTKVKEELGMDKDEKKQKTGQDVKKGEAGEGVEEKPMEPKAEEKTVPVETYARLAAEFDNYMKRTEKEKAAIRLAGKKDAVLEFLSFADELDMAKKSFEKSKDEGLKTGFDMLHEKFKKIMQKSGIERIECVGKDFDSETCDAVMVNEADSEGKVLFEIQPGYRMNGIVIRHAKVAVSKMKEKTEGKNE